MQAKNIMATDVATVGPQSTIKDVVRLMIRRQISGVPVVDGDHRLLGMVTEGDLLRRVEAGTERGCSTWRDLFRSNAGLASDYLKSHARTAHDVMTAPVISVAEDAQLSDIAEVMQKYGIKRVPVTRDGQLLGMVSRIDLIRFLLMKLLATDPATQRETDRMIHDRLIAELRTQRWADINEANVEVKDGIVHLWGIIGSPEERAAMRVAAENIPGVRAVHVGTSHCLI